jgi:hypothetical protein
MGWVVNATPRPLYPREIDEAPNLQEAGLQGRSGKARKISPQPGFDSRTVQPIASRYTDWTELKIMWNKAVVAHVGTLPAFAYGTEEYQDNKSNDGQYPDYESNHGLPL